MLPCSENIQIHLPPSGTWENCLVGRFCWHRQKHSCLKISKENSSCCLKYNSKTSLRFHDEPQAGNIHLQTCQYYECINNICFINNKHNNKPCSKSVLLFLRYTQATLIRCRRKGPQNGRRAPHSTEEALRSQEVPRSSGDEKPNRPVPWKDPGEAGAQINATLAQQHLTLIMIAFSCLCAVPFHIIYSSNENNYLLVLEVRIVAPVGE